MGRLHRASTSRARDVARSKACVSMKQLAAYFATATEREAIRRRRLAGEPWPWTSDAVLSAWRFCNVHREHDKTTEWFRNEIRAKLTGLAVIEACVIFRWFNRI